MNASIVKNASTSPGIARAMDGHIEDQSCLRASIVKSALAVHQIARNTKKVTRKTVLLNLYRMISVVVLKDTLGSKTTTPSIEKSHVLVSSTEENSSQVESLTCWICQEEFNILSSNHAHSLVSLDIRRIEHSLQVCLWHLKHNRYL
ncbi:hypothetical protein ACROYT_G018507 [Oculina patagonica]